MKPSERERKIFRENADTKISKATPQEIKDFAMEYTAKQIAKSMGRKRPRNGLRVPYNSPARPSVRPSQIALPPPRRGSVVRIRHSPINRNTRTRRSNFYLPQRINNTNSKTNAQRSRKKKRKKKTKNTRIKKRKAKKRKSNKRKSNIKNKSKRKRNLGNY